VNNRFEKKIQKSFVVIDNWFCTEIIFMTIWPCC